MQRVNEQLRAPHRERRNNHLSAVVQRVGEQCSDFVRQSGLCCVLAVAVGALDKQHIDVLDGLRVTKDRVVAPADVAAEQQPAFRVIFVDVEDHLC